MLVLQVYIKVLPEKIDEFIHVTRANCENSRKEAGVLRFDLYQQADDPTRFTLSEVYRDSESQAEHKLTEHYKTWLLAAEPLMAEPRTRTNSINISPTDAEWA